MGDDSTSFDDYFNDDGSQLPGTANYSPTTATGNSGPSFTQQLASLVSTGTQAYGTVNSQLNASKTAAATANATNAAAQAAALKAAGSASLTSSLAANLPTLLIVGVIGVLVFVFVSLRRGRRS